jgi:drug/metabolite transporter (DMT)-like permease
MVFPMVFATPEIAISKGAAQHAALVSPDGAHQPGIASLAAAAYSRRLMSTTSLITGTQDRPLSGIFWMLAAGFILSVMDGLIKWSVNAFPVAQVVLIRSAFVLLMMVPMIVRAGGWRALKMHRPLGHALRAFLAVASILTFFESVRLLPLATVIAIGFGAPLLMTAMSVPVLGEKVGVHRWTAIAIGFIGVLVITRPTDGALSGGALLALVSSVFFAMNLVAARWLARTETDIALMFWQNAGVLTASAILAPFAWTPLALIDLVLIAVMGMLLLLGQFCTVKAFRTAPVGAVAPFQYVELIWAAAIGYLFWREAPSANVWIGAAIVVASGLYVIWRERVRAQAVDAG